MSRKRERGDKSDDDVDKESDEGSASDDDGPLRANKASSTGSDDDDSNSTSDTDSSQLAKNKEESAATKSSFCTAALKLLSLLLPEESVNALMHRISSDDGTMAVVSDAIRLLLADHDANVVKMSREALLTRTLRESLRQREPIPAMWFIRWDRDAKRLVHGPFSSESMEGWRTQNVFLKKAAAVLDGAAVGAAWVPATSVQSFACAT